MPSPLKTARKVNQTSLIQARTMSDGLRSYLLLIASLTWLRIGSTDSLPELQFVRSPSNVTSSLSRSVRMECVLRKNGGEGEPVDIEWQRDGQPLDIANTDQFQVPISDGSWQTVSTLRIEALQLSDMGSYSCVVMAGGRKMVSQAGYIQLEDLPHFSVEPQDMVVTANSPLSLYCEAHGPPEPVWVIWLRDGIPLTTVTRLQGPNSQSPSTLNVTGLNKTSTFSCEARNDKGVATSGSGTVTVIPSQPEKVETVEVTNSSLHISWQPGFGGNYPVTVCSIQATRQSDLHMVPTHHNQMHNQNVNVPPARHLIPNLKPFTNYSVRVACLSSQGISPWSPWVTLRTSEGVPEVPPVNISAVFNDTVMTANWAEPSGQLNGRLLGYRLAYSTPLMAEVVLDVGLSTRLSVNLSAPVSNVSVRVCAYTGGGAGPWSSSHTFSPIKAGQLKQSGCISRTVAKQEQSHDPLHPKIIPGKQVSKTVLAKTTNPPSVFSWHWWYVVMATAAAVALTVLIVTYVVKLRRKETRFGEAFQPTMDGGDLVVRYHARRSYGRRTMEATLNSLVISDDLKQKLQDVMIDRHKLTLGKTLGEGEFGSVMEGLLTQEEFVLKVAVKTMKIAICTRTEMEDFLREAACMKEFDHQNVMRLIGVCLQTVESEGYPSPVVILPYMKHGDLHSYLLYSRLGDCPVFLPSQMLVKFMTDIARGMEYLSSKSFIHRDLAARNCMLNENMTVCVADFGLSKKIYNGDYYRQGRISKMPVKWIAIESLADRVYTTKSDVWSFGVTMWEIATRGQTPYPGVENSEIYDYLRQGNRLKQPPGCLDVIYSLMFSCWLLSPKDRPSFETLRCELEKVLEELPETLEPEEILYVNMDEPRAEQGAVGGREPPFTPLPFPLKGMDSVTTVEVHQPGRYVLCPQHETQKLLSDSTESLNLNCSSSNSTLLLQRSSCSAPLSEQREDREGGLRKAPRQ